MTLITLGDLPRYTGSLEDLRHGAATMGAAAWRIKRAAEAIDTDFRLTATAYRAPESDRLFSSSRVLSTVGTELHAASAEVRSALLEFANTVQALLSRLNSQRSMAAELHRVLDADPREPDRVRRSDAISRAVDQIYVEFQEAERIAANRVNAACGHPTQYTRFDAARPGRHMYGLSLDQLQEIDRPWGDPRQGGFLHGFVVDGIWGTILGMKELATSGEAWEALAGILLGLPFSVAPDGIVPEWAKENRELAREFGKAFVGWDHWDGDASRASGIVVFNLLTLGSGSLAKLGAGGRLGSASTAARVAAEVGRRVDPTTYMGNFLNNSVAMGIHFARLNQLGSAGHLLPNGSVLFPDGNIIHPNGQIDFPDGTTVLPDNTTVFAPGGFVDRFLPDGTIKFTDGTEVRANPPIGPREQAAWWSSRELARKRYPHVDSALLEHVLDTVVMAMSYTPGGQIDEARNSQSSAPEYQLDGPR